MDTTSTELAAPALTPIVISQYEKLESEIAIFRQEKGALSFNYEDPAGNKAARSLLFGARKLSGDVERARKAAKAYALEYGRKVDAGALKLDTLIMEIAAPHKKALDAIEAREAEKLAAVQRVIDKITEAGKVFGVKDLVELNQRLDYLAGIKTADLGARAHEAESMRLANMQIVSAVLDQEAQKAALEKQLADLREDAARQMEAARVTLAAQAAAAAAVEAERQRVAAEQRAEMERQAIAIRKQEAEQQAAEARRQAEHAERVKALFEAEKAAERQAEALRQAEAKRVEAENNLAAQIRQQNAERAERERVAKLAAEAAEKAEAERLAALHAREIARAEAEATTIQAAVGVLESVYQRIGSDDLSVRDFVVRVAQGGYLPFKIEGL